VSVLICPHCGRAFERNESVPLAPSVTPMAAELARLRALPPTIGSQVWFRHQTGYAEGCVICGGALPQNGRSRRYPGLRFVWGGRMFCSDACRQKGHRMKAKAAGQVRHAGNPQEVML
jgi:hypothetical protein